MTFSIQQVDWQTERESLLKVRFKVFVEGQNVPAEIEVDDMDAKCQHFLAVDADGSPIGTARVDDEGHIGRVAVLEEWRGKNVGRELMEASLDCVRRMGLGVALLNSQTYAAPFYEKLGFAVYGDEFTEAGIPHFAMKRQIRE